MTSLALPRLRALTPVALRRRSLLLAIAACGLFALSVTRQVGLTIVTESLSGTEIELSCGELIVSWSDFPGGATSSSEPGLHFSSSCDEGYVRFAWRPYHSQSTCVHSFYEGINFPLWIPAAASLLFFGHAHGLVRGLRRVDRARCNVCGMDLAHLPLTPDQACPSCGSKAAARKGLACRSCGYDLRGTPRDPRGRCTCPECGAATVILSPKP